jgi:Flp pilus assembly protein TadG
MKNRTNWLKSFLGLFSSESGSALPLVGVGILALVGSTGTAVDMGRVQIAQSKMSSALDAAGLAAGAVVNSGDTQAQVNKYFNANFPAESLGVTMRSLTITTSEDNMLLTLDATGAVDTTFMRVFGTTSVNISAHSEITRSNKGLELVLVMDTTGSMGNNNKLQDAKTAANMLIDILYGDRSTVENMWVGLVPFSQTVNIGTSRSSWTATDSFNWGTTSWRGCVDARETSGRDSTDDPPSVALFPKYYWPDDNNYNNWISTSTETTSTWLCRNNNSCTCANYGPCSCVVSGNSTTCTSCSGSGSNRSCQRTVSTQVTNYTINNNRGPNLYCTQEVTPMTKYKSTIVSGINSMNAAGNTHVNLGAVWGWRMLSPRWRGLWGGEMNTDLLPLNYNTPLMNKVMVLMTDGENTMDNNRTHTAYWYLRDGKLGTTSSSAAVTQLNTRLTSVCTAAKAQGIIIYTIGFGNPGSTISSLLRSCATRPEYYFDSPTGEDLNRAFQVIGDSLANLRISR